MSESHHWEHVQPLVTATHHRRDRTRLALLIRHTVRNSVRFKNAKQVFHEPISETGRMLAHRMGHNLCFGRPVRLFYSPVPRCAQTAEALAEGVVGNGCHAEVCGERGHLEARFSRHPRQLLQALASGSNGGVWRFLRRKEQAAVDRRQLEEFEAVGEQLLNGVLDDLHRPNPDNAIVVNISHDLTLMTLLHRIVPNLDRRFRWPEYLEGVLLMPEDDRISVWFRGEEYNLPLPG